MADRPNILWICTDQQRYDSLGCYGNDFVRTPNVDGLAGRGTLFEHCYSQSPVCTPSRASFLTGRYPRTTRTRQNGQSMPGEEKLITRMLADEGYVCGLAGKLHLSASHPDVTPVSERRIDDGYHVFLWSHHPPHMEPDFHANEYSLWLRQWGEKYETEPFRGSKYVLAGMPAPLHHTTWCVEMAKEFVIGQAETGAPWLFSLNIFDPHNAFDPPAEYLERYLEGLDEIPLPNYVEGELDDKPGFQRMDHEARTTKPYAIDYDRLGDKEHRLIRASYWAMCDLIDERVGELLEVLEETGQAENTLVIFMSDHGEMLGDHGIYLKGPYFYDPAIRVPLVMSWPGRIPEGARSGELVELSDIAPTILEAAGVERPAGMQAKSLWPVLTGAETPNREDIYCEYYNAKPWHKDPTAQLTCVRTRRHKLVAAHGRGEGELYDLEADPKETKNLWDDPEYREVKMEMYERMVDRMAWTVDPLPERQAEW